MQSNTRHFLVTLLIVGLAITCNAQITIDQALAVVTNEMTLNGDFQIELQVKGTNLPAANTLGSATIDIEFDNSKLTYVSSSNWAFGFAQGYTRSATDNTTFIRVFVAGVGVNQNGGGDPPGYDIQTTYDTWVQLNFTITDASGTTNLTIEPTSNAIGLFENYQNEPNTGVINDQPLSTPINILDESLPVELTSFTANVTSDMNVQLQWVTESEINNQGFEVYRSEEEEGTYDILSSYTSNNDLVGQGNSSTKHAYQFTDNTAMRNNIYWYKIADVDLNGIRTYHGPLSILVQPGNIAGGEDPDYIPKEFQLIQNFPNPFNPETKIRIGIPDEQDIGEITINIYDIMGQKVRTLFQGNLEPGMHTVKWNGLDASGKQVSGGTYFYYLKSNKFHQIKKMILMK